MKKTAFAIILSLASASLAAAQHDMGGMHHAPAAQKSVYEGRKDGIAVKVKVNDIAAAMKGMKMDASKMDPAMTHHVAVTIDGSPKKAVLKLTFKGVAKEYALMEMQGHFGSDVSMKEKGSYDARLVVTNAAGKDVLFVFKLDK